MNKSTREYWIDEIYLHLRNGRVPKTLSIINVDLFQYAYKGTKLVTSRYAYSFMSFEDRFTFLLILIEFLKD